jgi:hypothetical protein
MTPAAQPTKKHSIAELEELYKESEDADAEVFAEMRSNILLISGDHYAKKSSRFYERIRDTKQIPEEQKIRLTKNHVQRITKTYVNNIITYCPGVSIGPKNDTEIQDQKAAQLHTAVWEDAKEQQDIDEKTEDWADDFVGVGEVATKIYWDKDAGKIIANYEVTDEKTGQPMLDMNGAKVPGEPVFSGALCFEDIYGFNLLRPKSCKNLSKAEWLGSRKMVPIKEALRWVGDDEQKKKFIQQDQDKTYIIFDAASVGYGNSKNQVLIKEYYFRPCAQYPQGWFYITTEHGVLFEGELPYGVFPIVTQHFEKFQTAPRGRSIIKVLRPYQIEINRAASKMAEHQITLGDDKIIMQKGSTLQQGGVLPGVRGLTVTGKEPTILNGRDGSQYLNYMNDQIEEMYKVAMVAEDTEETNKDGQLDPYALLFKSARQKKRFTRYTRRFEHFLVRVTKLYLELAKHYFSDEMLIPAIGKREYVNIAEFRNTDPLCYQIKCEPSTDDLETKFGKMMGINHALQYVGNKLDKEDIGKLMRALPYANDEESFSDFTLDYDNSTNDILALERGETPIFDKKDNHPYVLKRLRKRQRESDYRFLSPMIKGNFERKIALHEAVMAEQAAELQRAQAGFIPTDGYMVVVDLYASDPANPKKTQRMRIPYSSLMWLVKRLEDQGLGQQALEGIDNGTRVEIAHQLAARNGGAAPGGGIGPNMSPRGPGGMSHDLEPTNPGGNVSSISSALGGLGGGNARPLVQ